MAEYGCATSNKFGLPSDDDDEFDDPKQLIQRVSVIAAKQKEEKLAKPVKEAAPVVVAATRGRGGRGGRGGTRGRGGGPRQPRDGDNRGPRKDHGTGLPAGRGGHGGRGGRGGFIATPNASKEVTEFTEDGPDSRGADRRGSITLGGPTGGSRGGRGRQFDRQSGSDRTGVRAFDKKDGHGKGNWGDKNDELTGETEDIDWEGGETEVSREKTAEQLAYEAALAEFNKVQTLKEFRAQQSTEEPKFHFNTRMAGEGVPDYFGPLVRITKKVITDRDENEAISVPKASRKKLVEVSIHFRNERRERQRTEPKRSGGARPFHVSDDAFPELGAM